MTETVRIISPIDGSVYAERPEADDVAKRIDPTKGARPGSVRRVEEPRVVPVAKLLRGEPGEPSDLIR